LRNPPPDPSIFFQRNLINATQDQVGIIKIKMTPTQAFVVGDQINAEIEVQVFGVRWRVNETCIVQVLFRDAIYYTDSSSNITKQDYPFIWVEYQERGTNYLAYLRNVTVWYLREDAYALNITILRPMLRERWYQKFYFPEFVQIKSHTYLEQKTTTHLTNALTTEILGLTYIIVAPVAVQLVSLVEKLVENITKEKKKQNI